MASWFKVAEFPGEAQLEELDRYLHGRQVSHRFTEERGKQILWLADASQLSIVKAYFETPQVEIEEPAHNTAVQGAGLSFHQAVNLFPLTLLTIILGLLGYLYQEYLFDTRYENPLSFLPAPQAFESGQVWRLLSPAFLHFGTLHILFNGLWIWELGRRIEIFTGKINYLLLFLISAIGANYIQYFMSVGERFVLFGGLSGVVYAYLGYLLVWHRFSNNPLVKLPAGVFIFMLLWLALGFSGLIDFFISGSIANGAHLGGLLCGIAYAAIQVYWRSGSTHSKRES